ncbi:hypothetical protein OL313_004098 [Vibrio parahaemolyticus]|nr:hypothetical protein [Vibrio parahaemolyticus]EJG0890436.1 hypothetical protein [Vibrio parahaemolyticus]EKA7389140.1 hypothetical protein [Vibrio parahaemolyticus]ELA9320768.1 hypothetical protein [Vibrio parahaemolyticus]
MVTKEIKVRQSIDIINATHFIYIKSKSYNGEGRNKSVNLLVDDSNKFMNKFIQNNKWLQDDKKITITEVNSFLIKNNTRDKVLDLFDISPNNLQQSSRAINWLWGYIQINFDHEIRYIGEILDDNEFYMRNEDDILQLSNLITSEEINDHFNKKSNNLDNKLEQVINFINHKCILFDVIDNYLRELHNEWVRVFGNTKFKQFITKEKNKDESTRKSQFFYDELIKIDDIDKELEIFEHCTVNDPTAISQAILDLLTSNLEQQAIILKISKKWSSKKNRNNGKVSFSTTMLPETKNKLDQIVNHSYSNISTTLQKIIDQEHERLFKKVK